MKKLLLFSGICISSISLLAQTPEAPLSNPNAPKSYAFSGKIGDSVTVVDQSYSSKSMMVIDIKKGMIRVARFDASQWELKNNPYSAGPWYKANSVYSYYNYSDFNNTVRSYKELVTCLIPMYAKSINTDPNQYFRNESVPLCSVKNYAEYKSCIELLAELNTKLSKYKSLPNTYLDYKENPSIWVEIAKNGKTYLDMLREIPDPDLQNRINMNLGFIEKTIEVAKKYTGAKDQNLYSCSDCHDAIYRAVSPSKRKEFFEAQKFGPSGEKLLNAKFDELKALVESKIPLMKPESGWFQYKDPANELIMKNYVKPASTVKIHSIGAGDPDWIVVKQEYTEKILYRYKRVNMYIRNTANDFPYCKALHCVIKQDYIGNGTYGKSVVSEYSEELMGCP